MPLRGCGLHGHPHADPNGLEATRQLIAADTPRV